MRLRTTLMACMLPIAAFAQSDAGGGAAAESKAMQAFADMLCNQNPYTEQTNTVTGEKTGPMELIDGQQAAQVLANGYAKEWSIGGKTFIIRKVVQMPYQFDTSRNGQQTGKRQENILILYAGGEGPG